MNEVVDNNAPINQGVDMYGRQKPDLLSPRECAIIAAQCRLRGGAKPYHIEGTADGTWSLLDYGSFIVHVFQPETRDYYRLESLWNDAPLVDLEGEAGLTDLTYSERIAKLIGREA